jgi:FkbM family methyltransferase
MSILETKKGFNLNKINKGDFINKMHEYHKILFDFSESLKNTEISKIEIEDDKVLFTSRITDFHPGGCRFVVDVIDKRITPLDAFNFDTYEKEDSEMLYNLVSDGDTIFDVGANIGWYSNHLSKKLPNSLIYSFEPIPETFYQLKLNTELNDSKNIILNNIALSAKKEKVTFYYSPLATGASSLVNITESENIQKLECETNTLDDFFKSNNVQKIDFIKCDVEGAELLVFKGGFEIIKEFKPIIFTEMLRKWSAKFGYHPNDIILFFSEMGYKCFYSSNGKLNSIKYISEETVETNFFFLFEPKHHKIINNYSV